MNHQLELHYHLPPGEHAMNAYIRNKCEAEALAAFKQICERLGVELTVEALAHTEGGIRDTWRFIMKPEHAYANVMLLLSLLLPNFIAVWNVPSKPDKELETINKDIAKATLQEKLLAIETAKKALREQANQVKAPPIPAPAASAPRVRHEGIEVDVGGGKKQLKRQVTKQVQAQVVVQKSAVISKEIIAILAEDPKFVTRRSNFYKALLPYDKVKAVGWTIVQEAEAAPPPEVVVYKKDFIKFVLTTDKLPTRVIEEAFIQIVAPVIDNSGVKWKGLHEGESISFAMKDEAFKQQVLRREVSFQAGNAIKCRLEIALKLDETGEEAIVSYSVPVVIEKIDESGSTETSQGRRQRFYDRHADAQHNFGWDDPMT